MKTESFALATDTDVWSTSSLWSVLFYEEGSASGQTARIRVRSAQGGVVDAELKPGRQLRLDAPVQGLIIQSLTGGGITGKISLGTGDIRDSSLVGEVSVIDGTAAQVMADQVFQCSANVAAAAGEYAQIILRNVAASTTNSYMEILEIATSSTGGMAVNIGLNIGGLPGGVGVPAQPMSQLFDGTALLDGSANFRSYANAVSHISSQLGSQYATPGLFDRNRLVRPILVQPLRSLVLAGANLGQNLFANITYVRRVIA